MVYTTVAEGYRVGGVNGPIPTSPPCSAALAQLGVAGAPPTFGSDTVWNYEVGTKDKLFGGQALLDLSVFHDEWKSIQQSVSLAACGGLGFIGNLGSAVSQGFDLALQSHIVGGLQLGVGMGYTNAYYTKTLGIAPGIIVSKGDTLGNAPWIITVTPEYDFKLAGKSFYVRAQDKYHSHNGGNFPGNNPESISYDPAIPLPPSTNDLDLRAGVNWGKFDVSLFVNNALNSHPGLQLAHPLPGDPLFYNETFQPLTAGVTVVYRN
jgi:iron complex outermembrane recepter protein